MAKRFTKEDLNIEFAPLNIEFIEYSGMSNPCVIFIDGKLKSYVRATKPVQQLRRKLFILESEQQMDIYNINRSYRGFTFEDIIKGFNKVIPLYEFAKKHNLTPFSASSILDDFVRDDNKLTREYIKDNGRYKMIYRIR